MFAGLNIFLPKYGQQVRRMATLKSISMRLKSVSNIQKITQSMKMVSAAKYARAERELKAARPLGEGAQVFYEKAEIEPEKDSDAAKSKNVVIAVTSDRGLCGAVHSSICKIVRNELLSDPAAASAVKIVCIGDKARGILQRIFAKNIILACNEVGRKPPVFEDASKVARAVMSSCGEDFHSGKILYNKFKSVVSYSTSEIPIYSVPLVAASPKIGLYDSLDADVMQNYVEFSLVVLIYYAMKESACSEQSSRMTAMDNSSKNAREMIDKLTLIFNRTRQAVITRELIEIISGASAI